MTALLRAIVFVDMVALPVRPKIFLNFSMLGEHEKHFNSITIIRFTKRLLHFGATRALYALHKDLTQMIQVQLV